MGDRTGTETGVGEALQKPKKTCHGKKNMTRSKTYRKENTRRGKTGIDETEIDETEIEYSKVEHSRPNRLLNLPSS